MNAICARRVRSAPGTGTAVTAFAVALLGLAGAAWALPPLTAHTDDAQTITWPVQLPNGFNGNTDAHQHWKAESIFGVGGKFKTYAAWDNANWRYDEANDSSITKAGGYANDYGHGFMALGAKYSFDQPGLGLDTPARRPIPGAAIATLGQVVVPQWVATVNQVGMLNSNGVPTVSRIDFTVGNVMDGTDPNAQIEVRFAERYSYGQNAGGANGQPGERGFPIPAEIDPDTGTWGGNPEGGGTSDGVLAFWTPSLRRLTFNSLVPWYFGQSNDPTVAPTAFDFWAVALHEFGHVLGLDHPDAAIQFTTMYPSMGVRGSMNMMQLGLVHGIDGGTLDGARALYTIPAPGALGVLGLGGVIAACRRRRPNLN